MRIDRFQRTYYVDHYTHFTSWEKPLLPAGWERRLDSRLLCRSQYQDDNMAKAHNHDDGQLPVMVESTHIESTRTIFQFEKSIFECSKRSGR